MGTSTLHLNNPVPSNGAVAVSLGGRHTVTATLSGVGAISCKVQAWGSQQNTDSRKIGEPVVISGTTTVSQTLIFDAGDVKQFWLAVVEISPACTFTATVENDGSIQLSGAVGASNVISGRHLSRWWKNYWVPADQTSTSTGVTPNAEITEATGLIGASASYHVSAPIPVTPGKILVWWNDNQDAITNKGGFYDASGNWVAGVNASGIVANHRCLFIVPAGAAYVRMNISSSTAPVRKYWLAMRRDAPLIGLATKLSFEGDSITAGSGAYYDKNFPQVISDMTGIPVVNSSLGGRRISGASGVNVTIKQTDHLSEIGILFAGVNDFLNEVVLGATNSGSTSEFNGALNATLSYLVNGRPWQKWYFVTPIPQKIENPNGIGLELRDYCQAIIDACLRYGVTVLDANKDLGVDFRQTMQGWMFAPDNLHPNWLSTDLLAQYVLQGIATK